MRTTVMAILVAACWCCPATLLARTWTDDTGKFSVEAEFVRVVGEKVELKRTDGSIISVPLARLSAADRNHIRQLEAKATEPVAVRPPPEPRPRPEPKPLPTRSAPQALKQKVDANFEDAPLRDALRSLAEQAGANIVLDERCLNEAGIDPRRPITARSAGTLDAALALLLKDAGLAHLVRHDVVFVTTAEAAAEEYLQTRVYKLKRVVPLDALVADIQKNVAPARWDEAGGSGTIAPLIVGAVVVSQSAPVHRELESRYNKLLLPGGPPVGGWGKPVTFDVAESPLAEVVVYLQDLTGVEVRIDRAALAEVGLSADELVSLKVTSIPFGSALGLLTERFHLAWARDMDHIIITTPKALDARLVTVNYDVRGLSPLPDAADLIEAIHTAIAPESWEELGGTGTIGLAAPGQVAIRQSDNMHRQIELLLAALRAKP